ncbi:MAG: hypothetical protein WDZ28_04105 [Simkaniaceae bacterium]
MHCLINVKTSGELAFNALCLGSGIKNFTEVMYKSPDSKIFELDRLDRWSHSVKQLFSGVALISGIGGMVRSMEGFRLFSLALNVSGVFATTLNCIYIFKYYGDMIQYSEDAWAISIQKERESKNVDSFAERGPVLSDIMETSLVLKITSTLGFLFWTIFSLISLVSPTLVSGSALTLVTLIAFAPLLILLVLCLPGFVIEIVDYKLIDSAEVHQKKFDPHLYRKFSTPASL